MRYLLIFMVSSIGACFGQTEEKVFNAGLDELDTEPVFKGGESAMMAFIQKHVNYPSDAIENGESGTVYVQFVVSSLGALKELKIVRGVSSSLDAESMRVISLMPAWTPATKDGQAVVCLFTLPINFKLSTGNSRKSIKKK